MSSEHYGCFGVWFERPNVIHPPILDKLHAVRQIQIERFHSWCAKQYAALVEANEFYLGRVALPVEIRDQPGLLLYTTFADKLYPFSRPQQFSFIISDSEVYKIGPILPRDFPIARKVRDRSLRLARIALRHQVSNPLHWWDIVTTDDPKDVPLLVGALNNSLNLAAIGPWNEFSLDKLA